jgi:hypothetical protein
MHGMLDHRPTAQTAAPHVPLPPLSPQMKYPEWSASTACSSDGTQAFVQGTSDLAIYAGLFSVNLRGDDDSSLELGWNFTGLGGNDRSSGLAFMHLPPLGDLVLGVSSTYVPIAYCFNAVSCSTVYALEASSGKLVGTWHGCKTYVFYTSSHLGSLPPPRIHVLSNLSPHPPGCLPPLY